jgi:hypothetical protein
MLLFRVRDRRIAAALLASALSLLLHGPGRGDEPVPAVQDETLPALAVENPWYAPAEPCTHFWARAGASYFEVPGEAEWGAVLGAGYLWPLGATGWNGWASISANQFDDGTQVLGSLGLYKHPDLWSDDLTHRFSYLVLFDQFTDTRVDDLYLSQMRLQLGYLVTRNLHVGLTYAEPIARDHDVAFVAPSTGEQPGTLQSSQGVGAFVTRGLWNVRLTGRVGYRDDVDALMLGGGARVTVTENLGTYFRADYEDRGTWAGALGLELRFGGSGRPADANYHGGCTDLPPLPALGETVAAEKIRSLETNPALEFLDDLTLQDASQFWQGVHVNGPGTIANTTRTSDAVFGHE